MVEILITTKFRLKLVQVSIPAVM